MAVTAVTNSLLYSDESDLIKACIEGKRSAQAHLYHLHSAKMFGICLRYANNYHSAEDILQDGFIKVFQNIDRFKGSGSFEGWLKRIFINTSIEHYRKQIKIDDEPDGAVEVSDLEGIGHENLVVQDMLNMIQTLSPGYRTVFNMYAIEGYSHKEIAEILNITEGTSKSQLARARMLLQKMLANKQ